jgi:hypothetical protein
MGFRLTLWHPVFELDGKPVQRRLPVADGHRPFLADVSERQVEQFQQRLIARRARSLVHRREIGAVYVDLTACEVLRPAEAKLLS